MTLRLTSFLRPATISIGFNRFSSVKKDIIPYDTFANATRKDKNTYLDMIRIFEGQDIRRRGHVEFIYAALRHMEEFGVHKDLEVYKSLLDVLPKGRFIPQNIFQAEFMHYPKQQNCAVDVLDQMENNGVMPDSEMETMLLNVFGRRGIPLRKYWRMMYWMPKFKNLSPWRLPQKLPDDAMDLAELAIRRITSVDNDTVLSIFNTSDVEASLDRTWIVSAQSPMQKTLLENEIGIREKNSSDHHEPLVVRGAYKVYLRNFAVSYFTLTAPYRERNIEKIDYDDITTMKRPKFFGNSNVPVLPPSVHEQDDGTILAVCATGSSSRDSLLSWIRLLEKHENPALAKLPVVFTLTSPHTEIQQVKEQKTSTDLSK